MLTLREALLAQRGDITLSAAELANVAVNAAGITGDGTPELVVTPDQSGGPRVVIYDAAGFRPMSSFLGIDDANIRDGVRAGVGDVNADGFVDLVLSAGFGGGTEPTSRSATWTATGTRTWSAARTPDRGCRC